MLEPQPRTSSDGSRHSYETHTSTSTAPTSVHSSVHYASDRLTPVTKPSYDAAPTPIYCTRSSAETYASTIADEMSFVEEPESYDTEFELPEYRFQSSRRIESYPRPSTPSDFAEFFPSSRRMFIRHDDFSSDGNMNLRVETEDTSALGKGNIQLFHLRMHDLRRRDFSLRRYERSSGREVCNSKRKVVSPSSERNLITRSVSHAITSIVGGRHEFRRTKSGLSMQSIDSHGGLKTVGMKRHDSGYMSNEEDAEDDSSEATAAKPQESDNILKLEFSNYAQVEVKRKGSKAKRYDFEYWGLSYSWKRVVEKDGDGQAVSYHLFHRDSPSAIAHIVPEMLSPSQVRREKAAGGWISPCSMWISDQSAWEANSDVPDVIVATGLIALTDDSIQRHFDVKRKSSHQVSLPLTQVKVDMEFVSPRPMVEHVFQRRDSSGSTKAKAHHKSPLRFATPVPVY